MKAKIFFGLFVGIPAFIGLAIAFQALPDWGKSAVQCVGMLLAVLLFLLILTGGRATGGDAGQPGGGRGYQPPQVSGGDCPGGCSGAAARARDQVRMAAAARITRETDIDERVRVLSEWDQEPLTIIVTRPEPLYLPAGEQMIEIDSPRPAVEVPHRGH